MNKRYILIICLIFLVIFGVASTSYFIYDASTRVREKECFRSVEWFSTASEALNWALVEAPKRVDSFSDFIYYDYGILVTRHEIIVKLSEKYSFGYDVVIIFYGEV